MCMYGSCCVLLLRIGAETYCVLMAGCIYTEGSLVCRAANVNNKDRHARPPVGGLRKSLRRVIFLYDGSAVECFWCRLELFVLRTKQSKIKL